MKQMKLALDSTTERELLIDLWKIEELVQEDKNKKALKAIKELIKEIRFSEIIESYTLFDTSDRIREEDAINEIKLLVKGYDNDEDLGGNVRAFVAEHLK